MPPVIRHPRQRNPVYGHRRSLSCRSSARSTQESGFAPSAVPCDRAIHSAAGVGIWAQRRRSSSAQIRSSSGRLPRALLARIRPVSVSTGKPLPATRATYVCFLNSWLVAEILVEWRPYYEGIAPTTRRERNCIVCRSFSLHSKICWTVSRLPQALRPLNQFQSTQHENSRLRRT
jgi:hypothetical protein